MWSREEGAVDLSPSGMHLGMTPGRGGATATGLLDNGAIMWSVYNYVEFDGFAFQTQDQLFLFELRRDRQIPTQFTDDFPGIKIQHDLLHGTWPLKHTLLPRDSFGFPPIGVYSGDLSSARTGQLFFNAEVFGEDHPFMMEYVSE